MREDRGYICFPEVDIEVPFTHGMTALIQTKLPAAVAHNAMTTGRRYGAPAALEHGLIDEVARENDLLAAALMHLRPPVTEKNPTTLREIKATMYQSVTAALHRDGSDPMHGRHRF